MNSQTLTKARKYEEMKELSIKQEDRPQLHLSPRVGWMNDPNGFLYYQGKYHLFYQYHPYNAQWGPMHWGHAVSTDLLHWEYYPTAIAPDMPYDFRGCFSGSSIELPDGRHLLMYTGVSASLGADYEIKDLQTQCLAVGDGVNYDKVPGNPVLTVKDIPGNYSSVDFRDPKMWRSEDGTLRCVAAVCCEEEDHDGRLVLFKSNDGFDWKFVNILAENHGHYGRMWECPDFFEEGGKAVILISPQDMLPVDFEYHNGNGTVCLIGKMDPETNKFIEEFNQAIDYGIDFYAPQTIMTPDGRRILIGWMQNWDTSSQHLDNIPWFGQMTIPREVSIINNRLYQKPVRELEQVRSNKAEYKDVQVCGELKLAGIEGRTIDMEVEIEPVDTKNFFRRFSINFAQNEKYMTSVSFRPYESIVKIDRKFSGSRRALIHQRQCRLPQSNGKLKLRLILDRNSVEVFFHDGEYVMTAAIYTDPSAKGISFFADGVVRMNVTKYDIR